MSAADRLIYKQTGRARLPPSCDWVLRFPIRRRFGRSLTLPLRRGVLVSRRFGIGIDVMFLRSREGQRSGNPRVMQKWVRMATRHRIRWCNAHLRRHFLRRQKIKATTSPRMHPLTMSILRVIRDLLSGIAVAGGVKTA